MGGITRLSLIMAVFMLYPVLTLAAEVDLPITVRIIDCTTYEKAKKECDQNSRCCDIAEEKLQE